MRIALVTPAPAGSRKGNRVTALRWARILRGLGHRIAVMETWDGRPADLMVALHARRSAASIQRFHKQRPRDPLIVALTGTDLYGDIKKSHAAQRSLDGFDGHCLVHAFPDQPRDARHLNGELSRCLGNLARL